MAVIKTIIAFFLSFCQFLAPGWQSLIKGGESAFFEKWNIAQEYADDYAVELQKDPDKDFVILNITDVQFTDGKTFTEDDEFSYAVIRKLVNEKKPDLITVTGDNAWGNMAYIRFVKELDSLGIPWAPVMGNHDGQNTPSEFWCAYQMANAENCLFKFGPEGMGYGNYIINITENGKIIHTVFMMDTHSNGPDTPNGAINGTGYDGIWANQMYWYKWAVQGIAAKAGKTVESTLFVHIPLYQYRLAWALQGDDKTGSVKPEFGPESYGVNHEGIYSPDLDNGFFDLMKSLGSTKSVVCGHEHVNNFSIPYEGIRLTYALKCGSGCYWEPELNGGTLVTINGNGNASVQHVFVDPADIQVEPTLFSGILF